MEIRQLFKPTPHLARVDEALSRRRSEGRGGLKGVLEGPEGARRGPQPRDGCKSTVYFACAQDNWRCRVGDVVSRYVHLADFCW